MIIQQNFKIVGTGSYLPERKVAAAEIDRRIGARPGGLKITLVFSLVMSV